MSRRTAGLILLFMLGLHAVPAASGETRAARDFSSVDVLAAAGEHVVKGELVRMLLFPAEFGGEHIGPNVVYVTPSAAAERKRLIGTLKRMVEEGLVDRLDVTPAYKGRSVIPSAITFKAWHSAKDGRFEQTIQVW